MSRRLPLPDPTVVIAAPGPTPSGFTPGRIPYSDNSGRLVDDGGVAVPFTYDSVTGILSVNEINVDFGAARIYSNGAAVFASAFFSINNIGKIASYNNLATEGFGASVILDDVALTAQNASIVSTNFANAGNVGTYRISFYLVCSTADLTAGTIRMDVTFNDGVAARTLTGVAVDLTSTANKTTKFTNTDIDGSLIKLGSGSIAYSTTLIGVAGTSQYALYATLERLS